jgi:hypothetical protein
LPFAVLKDKKLLKRIISTSGQAKEGRKGLIGLWTNKQKDFETIKKKTKTSFVLCYGAIVIKQL